PRSSRPRASPSTSRSCYGWSPMAELRTSATSVASIGLGGSEPKAAAPCRSTPSASSTRPRAATSGSLLTKAGPSPARRHLDQLEVGSESAGRGDDQRPIRYLSTEPNAEVGAIHPKAMPVILTTPAEVETWMTGSSDEALKLQRPLPDGALKMVARG